MKSYFGSGLTGTRLAATLGATIILASGVSLAEQPQSAAFNEDVLNMLLESRNKKPASQATPQERESAVSELRDIYTISNLPRAKELAESPRIKAQLDLQRRATLFNAFATEFLANNEASDQEIYNVYQEQIVLAPPKEFKARHILAETQGEALALVKELQDGADFGTLARENSTGPSATSGGDLGWFTAQAMVKPFSDAVASLDDGGYTTAPVQTQFGWHVILREDSRDSTPPTLESVRDVIKQRIAQQKFQEFLANARSKATE